MYPACAILVAHSRHLSFRCFENRRPCDEPGLFPLNPSRARHFYDTSLAARRIGNMLSQRTPGGTRATRPRPCSPTAQGSCGRWSSRLPFTRASWPPSG